MNLNTESTEPKIYGTWRGQKAFRWYGHIYLMIGTGGSWVRLSGQTSDFEPYTAADLNEPKNRHDLAKKSIGGAYVGRYSTERG